MGENNMTFYQAMQLGAEQLKPMIKNEENKKTKQKYLGAFILKNILCILFCMLVVVSFSSFFWHRKQYGRCSYCTSNTDF